MGGQAPRASSTIVHVQSPNTFWPSDRKFFRRRARTRLLAPAIVIAASIVVGLAIKHSGLG
jgi:hypothetical protein